MGLDISYHSKVKKSEKELDPDLVYPIFDTSYNAGFLYQLGRLATKSQYIRSDESEGDSFGAGSYSGYNNWRNQLAIMAGYECDKNVWNDPSFNPSTGVRLKKLKKINGEDVYVKPFYELIYFSDCEGLIGPDISAKLYQDFVDFEDKAKEFSNTRSYYNFYTLYSKFKEAFRVASDDGLVHFH